MFRAKTVFVLGAGASAEVGLPVGDQLLTSICKLLDFRFDFGQRKSGDYVVLEALKKLLNTEMNSRESVDELNAHIHKGRQIIASSKQAISIDNIVDALNDKETELVAKLAIVRAIHIAEKSSEFFRVNRERPEEIDYGLWFDLVLPPHKVNL